MEAKAQSILTRDPASSDAALERTLALIDELDLRGNLLELETQGYTTVEGVLSESEIERTKSAILDRVEENTGKRPNPETATQADFEGMAYLPYMLYDDEVFEDILMKDKPLALITYLLGESCLLSSIGCHFKGIGQNGTVPLHSDTGNGVPAPFPPYSLVANVNYALTPYSREAGALAMVPRSHKQARQPTPAEISLSGDTCNPNAVSMDLSPGDCVVWHGNAWHGSFPRQIPGIRMNLAVFFARPFIVTQEQHKNVVPPEVLARHSNDERFKTLVAGKQAHGWTREGPDYGMMAQSPKGLYD